MTSDARLTQSLRLWRRKAPGRAGGFPFTGSFPPPGLARRLLGHRSRPLVRRGPVALPVGTGRQGGSRRRRVVHDDHGVGCVPIIAGEPEAVAPPVIVDHVG